MELIQEVPVLFENYLCTIVVFINIFYHFYIFSFNILILVDVFW